MTEELQTYHEEVNQEIEHNMNQEIENEQEFIAEIGQVKCKQLENPDFQNDDNETNIELQVNEPKIVHKE